MSSFYLNENCDVDDESLLLFDGYFTRLKDDDWMVGFVNNVVKEFND